MNRQDLFEIVHINTERKWEKTGQINTVFTHVTHDFCSRNRFWWRQMLVSFQTIASQGTYDLTANGVITSSNVTEIKIEEMIIALIVDQAIVTASGGFGFDFGVDFGGGGGGVTAGSGRSSIVPLYDPIAQIGMINNPLPQRPSRYFLGYNDDHTLVIDPPDDIYTIWLAFWAMPNPNPESTTPTIPLIPSQYHRVIISGMEAYIWEHVYGSSNPKYVLAKQDYEAGLLSAQARPRFSTNYTQQLTQSDHAIRST